MTKEQNSQSVIIYASCQPAQGVFEGDVIAFAVTEDGRHLASHLSSNSDYAKHDIGITSNWKHEHYDKVLGKGNWKIVWIDNPEQLNKLVKNR